MEEPNLRYTKVFVICCAIWASGQLSAQTQTLPLDVQRDLAIVAIERALVGDDPAAVVAAIQTLRELDPAADQASDLLFFEAEALTSLGQFQPAEEALQRFLALRGRSSGQYDAALALMLEIPAQRVRREAAEAAEAQAARERARESERAQRLAEAQQLRDRIAGWRLATTYGEGYAPNITPPHWDEIETRLTVEGCSISLALERHGGNLEYLGGPQRGYASRGDYGARTRFDARNGELMVFSGCQVAFCGHGFSFSNQDWSICERWEYRRSGAGRMWQPPYGNPTHHFVVSPLPGGGFDDPVSHQSNRPYCEANRSSLESLSELLRAYGLVCGS